MTSLDSVESTRFEAVYFDRRDKDATSVSRKVAEIGIKYSQDDWFPRIDPANFAANWTGTLKFEKREKKQIQISQGHADTKVVIDGETVFEGSDFADFVHEFSPGEHSLEVFHLNRWHVVDFKFTIQEVFEKFSESQLKYFLDSFEEPISEAIYLGIYASHSKDQSVEVDLEAFAKGKVIWLDTHEAVDWTLHNDPGIAAVVIASYAPGTRVLGLENDVPIVHSKNLLGVNSGVVTKCVCAAGNFHCYHQGEFSELEKKVFDATGAHLVGYGTGISGGKKVRISPFDETTLAAIKQDRERIREAERICKKTVEPQFDALFEED
ncbi:hypothetical protein [Roseibium aggregatum]|uniref:PA14 domain-containing protein n=1 Tax=Roseibium aggregatum TaxID=187304 RepID=A0A939IZ43_9HYPH|nr:hypothetical protein [Roseibium aggregatum]MBN9669656.1 hypothetical protein [Roseibium aggregatum]